MEEDDDVSCLTVVGSSLRGFLLLSPRDVVVVLAQTSSLANVLVVDTPDWVSALLTVVVVTVTAVAAGVAAAVPAAEAAVGECVSDFFSPSFFWK